MPNKSYAKGYRFQTRVKKFLEKEGWKVLTSPKSRFPDLTCWRKVCIDDYLGSLWIFEMMQVECKYNKYLCNDEKEKVKVIKESGMPFKVVWCDKKNKNRITFYDM